MIDKSGRNPIKTTKVVAHASVYAKLLKHRTVLCDDILLKENEIQWTVTTFTYTGPVRFAEKISRNTVPTDLLWEKNTVSAEKQAEKDRL